MRKEQSKKKKKKKQIAIELFNWTHNRSRLKADTINLIMTCIQSYIHENKMKESSSLKEQQAPSTGWICLHIWFFFLSFTTRALSFNNNNNTKTVNKDIFRFFWRESILVLCQAATYTKWKSVSLWNFGQLCILVKDFFEKHLKYCIFFISAKFSYVEKCKGHDFSPELVQKPI